MRRYWDEAALRAFVERARGELGPAAHAMLESIKAAGGVGEEEIRAVDQFSETVQRFREEFATRSVPRQLAKSARQVELGLEFADQYAGALVKVWGEAARGDPGQAEVKMAKASPLIRKSGDYLQAAAWELEH